MGTGVSSSSGFTGTLNYAEFAALANRSPFTGLECRAAAGTGTRQVTIAYSGVARVHNTLHVVSGATLSLAENTSGSTRIDLVCLLVDWTADSGAGDASLVAVQGTPAASPVAPYGSLSVTPGVVVHEPIAEVTVASGAGVLPASAVRDVRTGPWIAFTPLTPWANYGGTYTTLGGRLSVDGTVQLGGFVSSGSALNYPYAQAFFVLPHRWRPASKTPLLMGAARHSSGGPWEAERIDVLTSGVVCPVDPASTAAGEHYYSLDGITYHTGQT